jgi:predicted component of type VI protein secretion system
MSSKEFIQQLSAGNASEAKEMLNTMLSGIAFEALEDRKQEIAQGLFGGSVVEENNTTE